MGSSPTSGSCRKKTHVKSPCGGLKIREAQCGASRIRLERPPPRPFLAHCSVTPSGKWISYRIGFLQNSTPVSSLDIAGSTHELGLMLSRPLMSLVQPTVVGSSGFKRFPSRSYHKIAGWGSQFTVRISN